MARGSSGSRGLKPLASPSCDSMHTAGCLHCQVVASELAGYASELLPVSMGCFVALQADKDALEQLANEFEIDFVSLSFTRSREDVSAARDYLDSLNMVHTKVGLGQNPVLDSGSSRTGVLASR